MWVKILLLLFVFSFLFRTDHSFDQDLGRHLKLGEIISQTREVPKTNLFSYTNPDFPFINTHWLFEVLVYWFSKTIGLGPLLILKVVVILAAVWLTIKIIPKENTILLLPVGFIFLHVLRERAELRPEIFSFLFTASTLYILENWTKTGTKAVLLLPVIQLLWINTHIYFFVGLLIQTIYIIHSLGVKLAHPRGVLARHLGTRPLIFVFLLSVIVSLVNPNGVSGLLYPLNVTKNYGYTIVENQTMFLLESIHFKDPNFLFVKLSTGLIGLSLLVTFFRRQWRIKDILLSVSGLVLALIHVRSFPYLVFLSLPGALQNFGVVPWNMVTKMLTIITAVLLILESYFYLNGDYYRFKDDYHEVSLKFVESSKGVLNFVLSNNLPGPIYNNFDIGSYVFYRGYPKYQVFVDGRPEAYPSEFFQKVYIPTQSDYGKFKVLEQKWGFKTIIFSHTDQTPWGRTFLQSVVQDETWKLVYIDNSMVVFSKEEVVNQRNLKVIELSKLSPDSYNFENHASFLRIGLFLLTTQNMESGGQFVVKSLKVFPGSPIANLLISQKAKNKIFW